VALSLGSRPVAVSHHRALSSSDFPPSACKHVESGRLAHSATTIIPRRKRGLDSLSQTYGGGQNAPMGRGKHRWRWITLGVGAVLVLLAAGYQRVCDPHRLRARTLTLIQDLAGENVALGTVSWSLWDGLKVSDVALGHPASAPQRAGLSLGPPVVRLFDLRMRLGLVDLLGGTIRPVRVEVEQAELMIPCAPADRELGPSADALNFSRKELWYRLRAVRDRWPDLVVRQADVQLLTADEGHLSLLRRDWVHVRGRALPDGYLLRVESLPGLEKTLAEIRFHHETGEATIAMGWADLETLRHLVPLRWVERLAAWDVSGRVRVGRCVFRVPGRAVSSDEAATSGPAHLTELEMDFDRLRFELPLAGEREAGDAPPQARPFLQFAETAGRLGYRAPEGPTESEMTLCLTGRVNGAPFTGELEARSRLGSWVSVPEAVEPQDARWWEALRGEQIRRVILRVAGVELPTHASHARFLCSPDLPGAVRHAFDEYRPEGRVNLELDVRRPREEAVDSKPAYVLRLEPLGAACRYHHFPYPFRDVWGSLRVEDGRVWLENLCGWHGEARVCATGVVNSTHEWSGFDIVFRGENVPLDEDLYRALSAEYQRLWDHAAPLGLCDLVARVWREDGTPASGPRPHRVEVEGRMLEGSVSLGDAGRLEHASGAIAIRDGVLELRDLQGYQSDSWLRLSGRVWPGSDVPRYDLRVQVADLPLERSATFGADTTGRPQRLRFRGQADAWGRVWSEPEGRTRRSFSLNVKQGEFWGFDSACPWTDCQGWVRADDTHQEVLEFACRQDDARFEVAGVLPDLAGASRPLVAELHLRGPLERVLPQFVPSAWSGFAEALRAEGPGDVRVRFAPTAEPHGPRQRAELRVQAARMTPRVLPLSIADVMAELSLEDGRFELRSARARWQEKGRFEVVGSGTWDGRRSECDLSFSGKDLEFNPEFVSALPGRVKRFLERLEVRGSFDAVLPHVQLIAETEQTWRVEGRVALREAALRLGLPVTGLRGELSGVCVVDPNDELELHLALQVERAAVAGRPLRQWSGVVRCEPGQGVVLLDELGGKVGDGDALGRAWIDARTGRYELSLTLRDVRLADLFPPRGSEGQRQGWLSGTVYLRGRGEDAGERRGGGYVRIYGASFYQNPPLAGVMQAASVLGGSVNDRVEQADVQFVWAGSEIRLERVDIRGRDLRLVGEGTWNSRTDALEMTLIGAHPEYWPRLAMISDLVELAGKEIIQYRVRGTLASPVTTGEPLHKLNEALRKLLNEAQP